MTSKSEIEKAAEGMLTAVKYKAPPVDFGTQDEPNLCYEARIPIEFVEKLEAALRSGHLVPAESGWRGDMENCPLHTEVLLWREDAGVMFGQHTSLDGLLHDGRLAEMEDAGELSEGDRYENDWWAYGPGEIYRLSNDGLPTMWQPTREPSKAHAERKIVCWRKDRTGDDRYSICGARDCELEGCAYTPPNATPDTRDEEIARLRGALEMIRQHYSSDQSSFAFGIARAALESGHG